MFSTWSHSPTPQRYTHSCRYTCRYICMHRSGKVLRKYWKVLRKYSELWCTRAYRNFVRVSWALPGSSHEVTSHDTRCEPWIIPFGHESLRWVCDTMYRVQGQIPSNWHILSITRVTKSYLLALRTTQISSYFTKHSSKFLTHQAGNNPVTCFVPKPSHILLGYGNFNIFAACSTTDAQLTKTFLTKKNTAPACNQHQPFVYPYPKN